MTETATTDPVLTSSILRAGTSLAPTRADLSDLTPILRTHPIGSTPGIPYYPASTEIEGRTVLVAGTKATDIAELACVMHGEPIPVELRNEACAYEFQEHALILYKKKDTNQVS